MPTATQEMTIDGLLMKIYRASFSLRKFGKHDANTKIRADLESEIAEAEAELTRRGYTRIGETTWTKD